MTLKRQSYHKLVLIETQKQALHYEHVPAVLKETISFASQVAFAAIILLVSPPMEFAMLFKKRQNA